jgi:hypothetical protein
MFGFFRQANPSQYSMQTTSLGSSDRPTRLNTIYTPYVLTSSGKPIPLNKIYTICLPAGQPFSTQHTNRMFDFFTQANRSQHSIQTTCLGSSGQPIPQHNLHAISLGSSVSTQQTHNMFRFFRQANPSQHSMQTACLASSGKPTRLNIANTPHVGFCRQANPFQHSVQVFTLRQGNRSAVTGL